MFAEEAFAAEGVTLSGFPLGKGLQTDITLEKLIKLSAEGARRFHANLSGKRTKFFIARFIGKNCAFVGLRPVIRFFYFILWRNSNGKLF